MARRQEMEEFTSNLRSQQIFFSRTEYEIHYFILEGHRELPCRENNLVVISSNMFPEYRSALEPLRITFKNENIQHRIIF